MGYSFVFNHMRLLPMVLCSLFFFSLAGCDGLDSDGDGQVDYCEDQYPPELVLRKAEAFQCDYQNNPDASRYCYTAAVFKDEKQVEMLLRDNFVVIDDCPATELDIEINKIGGTCKNTRFTVKPIQDTGCVAGPRGERNISHLNPLDGTAEDVTVYLDDAAPSITCGFNRASHVNRNNSVSVNGKTLYHRLGDSVGSRLKLNNAGFFYTVNVSISPKRDLCILHRPIFFRFNSGIYCLLRQQDNCDEADVQISATLETNELHQSKIAEIIEYNNANSSRQFEFVYKDYR
jgi:hypothetical protein